MESGTAPLAPLIVISGNRGWGKTCWMQQYEQYLLSRRDIPTEWPRTRAELESALEETDRPKAIFADMLVPTLDDPLWNSIYRFVDLSPDSVVVASTIDRIPKDVVTRYDAFEVYEKALAFTPEEVTALAAAYGVDLTPSEMYVLSESLRGHPLLVRRQLEQLATQTAVSWINPDGAAERQLVRMFDSFGPLMHDRSRYLKMLYEAGAFRRFELSMLASPEEIAAGSLGEQFERLAQSPLGRYEIDQMTGHDTFEWSGPAWESIRAHFPDRAAVEARRSAFGRTREAGAITMALFYLLEMGAYGEAEEYVDQNLRLFLLETPDVVKDQLTALPAEVLKRSPNIALLAGEFLTRSGRSPALARRAFQAVLSSPSAGAFGDVRRRFRQLSREAFARVSLGDRQGATQCLDRLLELLGGDDDPGPVLTSAIESGLTGSLVDELFLPFWTAVQLDRHPDAIQLVKLMRHWAQPGSPTALATLLTIRAQEVFAGFPLPPSDVLPPGIGHSDAMQLLEEGRGQEALAIAHGMDAHRGTAPTRSAAEALVLIIRALEEPGTLTVQRVQETVNRSRRFWNDGRPSTFIAQAAVLAYLALERPDLSKALLAEYEQGDWFILVARAIQHLVTGKPGAAMELVREVYESDEVPRALAILDSLAAAAHIAMDQEAAAATRMNMMWMRTEGRLIRYALRMVPQELFQKLLGLGHRLHEGLLDVMLEAAKDPHVLVGTAAPTLSRSEGEVLELLRAGRTYGEIATARFVSINTVRTQVKGLYRKLGVTDKAEAVLKAEQLGLLD